MNVSLENKKMKMYDKNKKFIGTFLTYHDLDPKPEYIKNRIILFDVRSNKALNAGDPLYICYSNTHSLSQTIILTHVDDNFAIDDEGYRYLSISGRDLTKLEKLINRMFSCTI